MADDQKYSLLKYPLNSCQDFLKVCKANYPEKYNFVQKKLVGSVITGEKPFARTLSRYSYNCFSVIV